MNDTWTESARLAVDRFLDDARAGLAGSGTDVEEVVADLRRHIEEEAVRRRLTVVTEEDARAILATMGNLVPGAVPPPARVLASASATSWLQRVAWGMRFLFGVLLPVGTLILELLTHMCSQVLFDPIPGWLEVVAVAVVPLANAIAWAQARRTPFALPAWVWCANGAAVAIAGVYALRFLPYTPVACIGVLAYGFGFIPLAPAISLVVALRLKHLLVRRAGEASVVRPGGWRPAFWGALLAMVALYLPGPLTRYWASAVDTGSPAQARSALWWLRRAGSERELLGMAYGRLDRAPWDWLNTGGPHAAAARTVYYRVYGRPFNASPPPLGRVGARRGLFDEFEWDNDLGGAAVAGRVTGLSLTQSRIDGRCSADDGWAYHEWILEFRNDHDSQQREARAQIQLPPGGVVSRATLWVNGEEREAAFGGRDQARHAYSEVAVVRRRDPLLVTTCGPDRVLVQCFPIAPRGGTMKIRIGITSPMMLPASNTAVMAWPSLAERNFGLSPQVAHSVWLECLQPPSVAPSGYQLDGHMLHGTPVPPWMPGGASTLAFSRNPAAVQVEARDRHVTPETWVRQTVGPDDEPPPSRIALVVDGSITMRPHIEPLARALETGRPGVEITLWVAGDVGVENASGSAAALAAVLRRTSCEGGRDNAPALAAALNWAGQKPGGAVVWIHGPQPELPRSIDALNQATLWGGWTHRAHTPRLAGVVRAQPNPGGVG
jgi:hypothetical protein